MGFVAAQLLYFLDLIRRFLLIGLCLLYAQFHARPANHTQVDQGQYVENAIFHVVGCLEKLPLIIFEYYYCTPYKLAAKY